MYEFDNNKKHGIDLATWTWSALFDIARHYGWEPVGTVNPKFAKMMYSWNQKSSTEHKARGFLVSVDEECNENLSEDKINEFRRIDEEWKGGYFEGELQTVTEQDSINISTALEKAFADIKSKAYKKLKYPRGLKGMMKSFKSQVGQAELQKYISFFKEGQFTIWT